MKKVLVLCLQTDKNMIKYVLVKWGDNLDRSEKRILDLYYKEGSKEYLDAVKKLDEHVPIAYIVGEQAFYGEMYKVTPDTLIPRPDTEHVVEHIIKNLPNGGRLLDLCTGSGCIAISSLCHTKNTTATLVDISEGAVSVAKENLQKNGVENRGTVICADVNQIDLFDQVYDVISSNPPYVKTHVVKTLEKECSFEPYIAFDGGVDGMDFYKLILDRFANNLSPKGCFIFEIGYDQREDIISVCKEKGFFCTVYKDYGKNDRVAVCKKQTTEG